MSAGAVAAVLGVLLFFPSGDRSLEKIKDRGEITVLTRNNAHCYFEYKDRPMGFEYDLAKAFADHLGVELRVRTPDWAEIFEELREGKGDFIAAGLAVTPGRERLADFSDGYLSVQQRVIVHRGNRTLQDMEDLNGNTIHVRRGTPYEERLFELRRQGVYVGIRFHDETPTEEFIRMVAHGEIPATVANSNIAMLNRRYYPDVKMTFPLAEPQILGWAVRKGDKGLRDAINSFFEKIVEDGTYARIHDYYFGHVDIFDHVDLRVFHSRIRTRLPVYRDTIKAAADRYGFDWRLIAAMVYQESHFDPDAVSHTGVRGIMQLTEVTANEVGVDRLDPFQAIHGGVRYLRMLHDRLEGIREPDRTFIALACFNVGYGNVRQARQKAAEMGMDADSWSVIQQVLPTLNFPEYFHWTEHGYCRGSEPVTYVKRIRTYYDILRREAIGLS